MKPRHAMSFALCHFETYRGRRVLLSAVPAQRTAAERRDALASGASLLSRGASVSPADAHWRRARMRPARLASSTRAAAVLRAAFASCTFGARFAAGERAIGGGDRRVPNGARLFCLIERKLRWYLRARRASGYIRAYVYLKANCWFRISIFMALRCGCPRESPRDHLRSALFSLAFGIYLLASTRRRAERGGTDQVPRGDPDPDPSPDRALCQPLKAPVELRSAY